MKEKTKKKFKKVSSTIDMWLRCIVSTGASIAVGKYVVLPFIDSLGLSTIPWVLATVAGALVSMTATIGVTLVGTYIIHDAVKKLIKKIKSRKEEKTIELEKEKTLDNIEPEKTLDKIDQKVEVSKLDEIRQLKNEAQSIKDELLSPQEVKQEEDFQLKLK